MSQPSLKMTDLAKSSSGAWALNNARLTAGTGGIHALLGKNDAGKSTLLKTLAGAQPQTCREIWFNGETPPVDDSPVERQNKGVITTHQEFNLLPSMTAAKNMFLGREPRKRSLIVDERAVDQGAQVILDYSQLNVAPTTPVIRLNVAQQQIVEAAWALTLNARLIIMDEPSAALSGSEVESLYRAVWELKNCGVSITYVTHRLREVFQLCDCFTIFQDGRLTDTGTATETNVEQLIRLMVGRDVISNRRPANKTHHEDKPVRLSVRGLSREKPPLDPYGIALHDISFHAHAGEVLGIAGLVGTSRTEVARCLFGADAFTTGSFKLNGVPYKPRDPLYALERGLALVPESRKKGGAVLGLSIRDSLSLSYLSSLLQWRWLMSTHEEDDLIEPYRQALQIKMVNSIQEARRLSGGDQQKVVLTRCMTLDPRVLIVSEPARSIDVRIKPEVHQALFDMVKKGVAVIVISPDLPEVMAVSNRIITLGEGRLTGKIHGDDVNEERLITMTATNHNALSTA